MEIFDKQNKFNTVTQFLTEFGLLETSFEIDTAITEQKTKIDFIFTLGFVYLSSLNFL